MKNYKSVFIFGLLAALLCGLLFGLLFGVGRIYFRLTDGFRMGNIAMELPQSQDWEIRSLTSEEKATRDEALSQPYHYMDKGHQAYVFESDDGKYVLKLLKFQRVRVPEWLRRTWLPFSWEEWRVKRIEKKDRMRDSLLLSWKLAFDALKDEAAIIYVHINQTQDTEFPLGQKLILTDKIGLKHQLDLDRSVFLIQRKAPLLGPTLDQLVADGNLTEAQELLGRLIDLFVSEYRRGLAEKELFILRNTGVYQGRPIHIDTGRFEWDPNLTQPENFSRELKRKTVKLRTWLKEHHPELVEDFDRRVEVS
ncbi:MAG: hypothetical protein LLG04_02345 [Parachlamydia sp.]|nr:hypothetical protein [Parachlamydia sp.]